MIKLAIAWGCWSIVSLLIGDHLSWAVSIVSANVYIAAYSVMEKLDDLDRNSNSDTIDSD